MFYFVIEFNDRPYSMQYPPSDFDLAFPFAPDFEHPLEEQVT